MRELRLAVTVENFEEALRFYRGAGGATFQIFLLGLVFAVIALSSDALWALAAGTAGAWLRRTRWYLGVKRWVTGLVFVGLGLLATRTT